MDARDVLRQVPFLAPASASSIEYLAARSTRRQLARGEYLFHEGAPSHHIYVIVSGAVAAQKRSAQGVPLIMRVAVPYETPGQLDVVGSSAYSASAKVLRPSSLLSLRTADLRTVLEREPGVLAALLADVASITNRLAESLTDLAFVDLPRRLARLLLAHAQEGGPPLTQGELASHLAAARQSVNTGLRMLAEAGLITMTGAGSVGGVDEDGLSAFIDAET